MSFFMFIVGADTRSGHSCCIQMQTKDRRSDGHGQGQGWGCILNTPLFSAFILSKIRGKMEPFLQMCS